MGEVVAFRPKAAPVVVDELAEIIASIKPAGDWWTGHIQIQMAHHFRMTADFRRMLAGAAHGLESVEATGASELAAKAFRVWQIECVKQMFIPAECVRHLRWKQDWLRRNGGGTPETALAIARDEAALAERLEVVARQQAGKAARKALRS
ncbi:hypothetical protein LJR234_004600 [Mesorhizobium amorphae]|uniref:hypothetical protein n=1 Tax=Mesorhizobium amorphae TaxID=71433 RepID=UPI003ECD980E